MLPPTAPPSGGQTVSNGVNPFVRVGCISILALDLGTKTGWALFGRDGSILSGTESFMPRRFEGGGMRYLRFKRWITEIKRSADAVDAVFFPRRLVLGDMALWLELEELALSHGNALRQ